MKEYNEYQHEQAQIEEMARGLDYCDEVECIANCAECRARWLYRNNYRKIPDGAVVLDKNEYDKLTYLALECIRWRNKNCNTTILTKEYGTEVE